MWSTSRACARRSREPGSASCAASTRRRRRSTAGGIAIRTHTSRSASPPRRRSSRRSGPAGPKGCSGATSRWCGPAAALRNSYSGEKPRGTASRSARALFTARSAIPNRRPSRSSFWRSDRPERGFVLDPLDARADEAIGREVEARRAGLDVVVGQDDRLSHLLFRRERQRRPLLPPEALPEREVFPARDLAQETRALPDHGERDRVREAPGVGPLAGREGEDVRVP